MFFYEYFFCQIKLRRRCLGLLVQTDGLMTCHSRQLGCTQPMFRWELMVRQISGHICSRRLSCHRPFCRARCASNTGIPSHSPTICLIVHFALVRKLFLSLCGRLFLPLRSFLSDDGSLCRDSIVDLDKFLKISLEWSVWIIPGFFAEWKIIYLCKHEMVSDVSFVFHCTTLFPIREIILHDQSVFVSASRLIVHVQNLLTKSPNLVESAIPFTRFFGFLLHLARVDSVSLQTSQVGSSG